jgi:hypothetical protein
VSGAPRPSGNDPRVEVAAAVDADEVMRDPTETAWEVRLPVLGIPVRFASNAAGVIALVEEAYGHWRGASSEAEMEDDDPVRIRIILGEAREPDAAAVRAWLLAPDRLAVSTGASVGVADEGLRAAVARVTPALLARRDEFRADLLDALTLFVLTSLDRTPLHAAAIVRGDVGLVLTGPSGSGKSTLAYAALRAGLGVLSDEAVYVQSTPHPRVWGAPSWLYLTDEACVFFPEIEAAPRRRRAGGRWKRAVPLPLDPGAGWFREQVGLCLIERDAGPARFEPADPHDLAVALAREADPGFDRYGDRLAACVRALARIGGAWRVRVGTDPRDVVPCLAALMNEVARD